MGSNFVPVETILKIEEDEAGNVTNDQVSSNLPPSPVFVSTGTQCSPIEGEQPSATSSLKDYTLIAYAGQDAGKLSHLINVNPEQSNSLKDNNFPKHWTNIEPNGQVETSAYQNAKFLLMAPSTTTSQQYQHEEDFFHQFDYKTRNTIKTKQRRSNPYYRDQERSRQRTVMRLKRQDPDFREAEREKGRFRMRIKRLNPEFRKIERQRQRERMKRKRQDPSFREREREQQKNRLHEKRLDPEFREREKAQDRLRMQMKRHNSETFSGEEESKKEKGAIANPNMYFKNNAVNSTEVQVSTLISAEETSSTTIVFDSITDVKPIILKDRTSYEPFQYRRGPIYNFHLYSNGKEQWLTPANSCSKDPPQISIKDDQQESGGGAILNQDTPLYSNKECSEVEEHESHTHTSTAIELNAKTNMPVDSICVGKTHTSNLLFSGNGKADLTSDNLPLDQQTTGS